MLMRQGKTGSRPCTRCQAKGNGKQKQRTSQKGGAAGSVSQSFAAAKEAARRANIFAKQRFQRAVSNADDDFATGGAAAAAAINSASSRNRRSSTQSPAAAAAGDSQAEQLQIKPYRDIVVQHLQAAGTAGSSSSNGNSSGSGSSGSGSGSSRGRGAKRAAARSLLEAHSDVFQAALDLELQEEWREAETRLQSWELHRLASEGVALFALAAAPDGTVLFRDVLFKFFRPNRPLPFHSFSQGDIVLVSQGQPLEDSVEGVVLDYSSRWIRIALTPTAAAAVSAAGRTASWRLDLFANTVTHQRCSEALQQFAAGGGKVLAGQQQQEAAAAAAAMAGSGGVPGVQQQQQQEALWRLLAGVIPQGTSMTAAAAQVPHWARTPVGRQRLAAATSSVKSLVSSGQLNPSQGRAVTAALGRTLTLWQGPPGTGKTTTLLRFCEAAVKLLQPSRGQLLAVAASNVAVDNLVLGLRALGVQLVRLGQPVKVAPAVRSLCMDSLAANTLAGQEAAKLRKQLVAAAAAKSAQMRGGGSSSSSKRGSGSGSSKGGQSSSGSSSSAGGLWEKLVALEAAAAAEVLGNVQVVVATCVGAGDPVLAGRCFEVVVCDEATQAPEPAALVALAGKAQSLVLVGDPQQLPPTVKCQEAERLGLGISLFDRLQAMGLEPLLLNVQYRMHPAIAQFPAQEFYQGLLQSWPKPQDRPLPQGIAWPNPKVPIMFIQVDGPESRTAASISITRGQRETNNSTDSYDTDSDSSSSSSRQASGSVGASSFFNNAEAAVVARCLSLLLLPPQQEQQQQPGSSGLTAQEVCVITPYSGQVRAVQLLLAGQQQQRGSSSSSQPGGSWRFLLPPAQLTELEVKSVDGFQGREKEVVVFSAVRSNRQGRVGFLSDARRLNVALTRAKRGLVVVGDSRTLRHDPVWARWLLWAQEQGVMLAAKDVRASSSSSSSSSSSRSSSRSSTGEEAGGSPEQQLPRVPGGPAAAATAAAAAAAAIAGASVADVD